VTTSTLTEIIWGLSSAPSPLYSGTAPASGGLMIKWDVAINGKPYMLDMDPQREFYGQAFGNSAIAALRTQADQGIHAAEGSLTRDDFWRRIFSSFHHGAGQRWTDRSTSDEFRFRQSKGVNVWTHDRVSLLPDTTQAVASTTITEAVSMGSSASPMIFYVDNSVIKAVYFNADDTVNGGFSGVATGLPGNQPGQFNTLASSGPYVYAITGAFSPTAVYRSTGGGAEFFTSWATSFGGGLLQCIGVAHGRVMVGVTFSGSKIYDATTATPVLVGTLTDPGEAVCAFAEGTTVIYAASQGAYGHQSRIYSITYDPATAALGSPKVAGLVPIGETVQTIFGYIGFLFIGTDRGFRMCRQASDGSLTIGSLITTPGKVGSFTAIGQYVYFGWSSFDTTSSGIGRIDIATFTDADLVPAYASDIMASVVGTVSGLCTLDNLNTSVSGPRPYFAVSGTGGGIFQQHAVNLVSSGTLDTGLAGYGIPDSKDAAYIDVRHEPLVGSVAASLSADEGSFATVDVSNVQGSPGYLMKTGHKPASRHELRLTLGRQTVTTGPALTQTTLQIYPAVQRGNVWTVPIRIADEAVLRDDSVAYYDFWAEYAYFIGLTAARTPSTYQIGTQTFTVYVDDYKVASLRPNQDAPGGWSGTIVLSLKNLDRAVAA
jgi:hypothetical protein